MYGQHQLRTRALPRSADPSPQRTAQRIESLHRMSSERDGHTPTMFNTGQHLHPRPLFHQQQSSVFYYVCHGHCSGPECQFTQSLRHWQSLVTIDGPKVSPGNDLVSAEPLLSLQRLDEKRESLSQMRDVLAEKLESKQRHKLKRHEHQKQMMMRNGNHRATRKSGRAATKSVSPECGDETHNSNTKKEGPSSASPRPASNASTLSEGS